MCWKSWVILHSIRRAESQVGTSALNESVLEISKYLKTFIAAASPEKLSNIVFYSGIAEAPDQVT